MAENEDENSNEEEELRKKLEQRYRQLQIEEQKKAIMAKVLDADAYQRLMNVRIANPDLYNQVVDLLIGALQSGRLKGKLTDEQLKQLLVQLTSKPGGSITFLHK